MTATLRHFDHDYREDVVLRDGTGVRLRLVRADDKELLREGFRDLSPESRYLRFFGGKKELTDAELAYLTELDGENHLAIGATRCDDGREQGLGVARFVRVADDPTCAEPAVAVVDAFQSRGLGWLLLRRLTEAARERGIDRFRCAVLTTNAAVRTLLEEAASAVVEASSDGEVLHVEFSLAEPHGPETAANGHHGMRGILRAAADGVASLVGHGRARASR